MVTDLKCLPLADFTPTSNLRLAEHLVSRASHPVVDIHNHLGRVHNSDWPVQDVGALISLMDECNIETIVNLDGCWGPELKANLDRYDQAFPGRFATFCRLDWRECSEPGWPERLASAVRESVAAGARGIKLWKDIGLTLTDENGELFFLDDSRLEPVWEALGDSGIPALIHTADPVAFFQPLDAKNERLEELLEHPDWHFFGSQFPPLSRLLDALENTVAQHPRVTVIGAHVGCLAEDLDWVDRMLTAYPNFNVDIAARIAELGRQPRRTRRLIRKHPTRVLFGSDLVPPDTAAYRTYFRFLETDDEYFPYSEEIPPESGRWRISGLGLDDDMLVRVYGGNARALVPGLDRGDDRGERRASESGGGRSDV